MVNIWKIGKYAIIAFVVPFSAYGMEMSHPFKGAATGGFFWETAYDYGRVDTDDEGHEESNKVKTKLSYGVVQGISVRAEVGREWTLDNPDDGLSDRDSQTSWSGGVSISKNIEKFRSKTTIDYVQKDPNYRAIKPAVRLGYDFGDFFLHNYMSAEYPLGWSHDDDDKASYKFYLGAYRLWTETIASELGFAFDYDDNDKAREWSAKLRGDYNFSETLSLGLYTEYLFNGEGKFGEKWHGYTVGTELRVAF